VQKKVRESTGKNYYGRRYGLQHDRDRRGRQRSNEEGGKETEAEQERAMTKKENGCICSSERKTNTRIQKEWTPINNNTPRDLQRPKKES